MPSSPTSGSSPAITIRPPPSSSPPPPPAPAPAPDKVPISSKRERDDNDDSNSSEDPPLTSPRAVQRRRTENNKAVVVDLVASSSTEEKTKTTTSKGEQEEEEVEKQAKGDEQQQQKEKNISIPELITKRLWQLWSDDQRVVLATLTKLANICARLEQHDPAVRTTKAEFHTLGGHAAVVGAMTRFCDSQPILAEGIRVLHNAAVGNAEMKVSIGSLGGIKMILDVMKLNGDHKSIQKNGCGALSIMIYKDSRNAGRLVENGGISVILKAMMAFSGNTWLQLWACNCLFAVSSNEDWKQQVKETGAEKIVAATFVRHYSNEDIQESARRLLKQLL